MEDEICNHLCCCACLQLLSLLIKVPIPIVVSSTSITPHPTHHPTCIIIMLFVVLTNHYRPQV